MIDHPDQTAEAGKKLADLQRKTGKKPNIIVFLMDDVGWMDFGFNGGGVTLGAPTPDVDKVAAQGLVLTSAYSQPSCSPSRATILTGQLPIHHGLLRPPMYGEAGGLNGKPTIASMLSAQGYVTQSNVNVVEEMVNMISASRSYQNNIEVMNTTRQLLAKTLQLGE